MKETTALGTGGHTEGQLNTCMQVETVNKDVMQGRLRACYPTYRILMAPARLRASSAMIKIKINHPALRL